MKESRYKPLQKVRIVKYGHPYYVRKESYKEESKYYARIGVEIEHRLLWGTEPSEEVLRAIVGEDKPQHIITETEDMWICDMSPELVGQEGTVQGSYAFLYGDEDSPDKDFKQYSVNGIKGKNAWYDEEQLESVE
jgi:hypothetical protein